jgi:uncharacterized 2Fe-2S/4Fe-4S cluster protein (DUF4445 family)
MGKEIIVNIINCDKSLCVRCTAGDRAVDILRGNGIKCALPCGGNLSCQKCRILFESGAPSVSRYDQEFLTEKELSEGYRLLCRCVITGDCTVLIGKRNNDTDMVVEKSRTLGGTPKDYDSYAVAVDIGTTTIAASLIGVMDSEHGDAEVLKSIGRANSQRRYGADVISRIAAAEDPDVRHDLEHLVRNDVSSMVKELSDGSGVSGIKAVVITGNTTMLHMFSGMDTNGLGSYPYTPVTVEGMEPDPLEIFREKICDRLILMPGISAFIGADIVAGLYSLDVTESKRKVLMADLGTNGELAFWNKEKLRLTSTAAGPVFEAVGISCGMPSVPGAITHVTIDNEKAEVTGTIGNKQPEGLCGTGVLETVSELVRNGLADETGLLTEKYFESGFPLIQRKDIFFTQQDIRQVQLAKAAVASGIRALLSGDEPDVVYITGGLGSNLDIFKVKNIRMFPESFDGKIEVAGNTALAGAVRYAAAVLNGKETEEAADARIAAIRKKAVTVELAGQDDFDEEYIAAMNF